MKTKTMHLSYKAIFSALFLISCQSTPNSPSASNRIEQKPPAASPNLTLSENKARSTLKFRLNFENAFRTQCAACQPRYIKLQIKGSQNISEPLYAIDADSNGFIEINPDLPIQNLSAQVPTGNNWAAFAGLYSDNTANSQPLAKIGGVFHNPPPTDEQIELHKRALQTAHIVNAMHDLGDDRIFSPLDLQRYQAMTDALLGVEQDGNGSYTLGRVPDGDILDAETLAKLLKDGQLDPENPETAANLNIDRLFPRPRVLHSARVQSFTAGLSKLVINPESNRLFSFDIKQNHRVIYGLNTPDLAPTLQPYALGQLRNMYLSLGHANPTGEARYPVTYTYRNQGVDRMILSAHSQNDGALIWQHTFGDTPALMSDYVPTVWRNTRNTPETDDDTDRIFVTFNADPFNHVEKRGVYAIEDGHEVMRVAINDDFNAAGAINSEGSRLYVVGRSDALNHSKLYAVDTVNEEVSWTTTLPGETFTSSTPVLGKNGDIYITTYTLPPDFKLGDSLPGKLVCISPAGAIRWEHPLASASANTPIVDHREGQDQIYVTTDRGQIVAVNGDGALRWATLLPGSAGEGPVDAALLGEDLAEGRTLYQAMGNGLIYAIKDTGTQGEILWAQAPQAKVSRGMVLKDGFLFAPTLDGGEGQWVQIKAIQVHSYNVPGTAPWPLTGGNLLGQHTPHQEGN